MTGQEAELRTWLRESQSYHERRVADTTSEWWTGRHLGAADAYRSVLAMLDAMAPATSAEFWAMCREGAPPMTAAERERMEFGWACEPERKRFQDDLLRAFGGGVRLAQAPPLEGAA